MGWGNESLCVGSGLLDKDRRHDHIHGNNLWTEISMPLKLVMQHC